MTAQISDIYRYKGEEYEVVAIEKQWPFNISSLAVKPVPPHTACWAGYYCEYSIENEELVLKNLHLSLEEDYPEINGVKPEEISDEDWFDGMRLYKSVNIPISYSGGMIVATDFIDDYYVHMGFQQAYAYKTVYELIFEEGKLIKEINQSFAMAKIREDMKENEKNNGDYDMMGFIENAFSLTYEDKWF